MIHRLRDLIGGKSVATEVKGRGWARAVPMPFYGGLFDRLGDAWAVLRGNAYAVRWPDAGELEDALNQP